jgi:glyoxylase-like metal-dependent hydrolase (beta-lactamase superfamily II)
VLVDTGLGNKEGTKFHDIYGVENAGAGGRTLLEDGLRALGHAPEDVRVVVNTHLHFDHAGGNTYRDESGEVRPSFPNAGYLVHAGELDYARHTNERTAASYLPPNWEPVAAAGRLVALGGEDPEVVPGVRLLRAPGHTPYHHCVLVESGGEAACFLADLVPTHHHLPLPWIMGYDVEPLVTLESKRRLLARAEAEGWLLVFEHDADVAWGRARHDGRQFALAPEPSGSAALPASPGAASPAG